MAALHSMNREQDAVGWRFDNSYARLPDVFFTEARPATVAGPRLVILNRQLMGQLGLDFDQISPEAVARILSGQDLPDGSQPIAQAYAGHQFGNFTMLGDGRAILLGEHRVPAGQLVDIQFKGSGQTAYSRRGDGCAALGPMLREYLISEAMFAFGIPTTRSLAVVATGQPVYREVPLPGAVLTRVAASHIRVGTFQYLAAQGDDANLRLLADYTINRHCPELAGSPSPYEELLRAVINRQASLIAQWQLVGFIHGVMNTDNMAISGETIDYGPCAFMNGYDPNTVFSSIDRAGRYAYRNQPKIAHWNLARFAESLLPLLDPQQEKTVELAMQLLDEYPPLFDQYWLSGMRAKLGLQTVDAGDLELVQSLLTWMQNTHSDFTNTFREISADEMPSGTQYRDPAFEAWYSAWQLRLRREGRSVDDIRAGMRNVNPAVIPRNHLVEAAITAAQDHGDLSVMERLLVALSAPYATDSNSSDYQKPPTDESGYRTFCGT